MAAIALVRRRKAAGLPVDDAAIDSIRNVCRCGTYPRIREAIEAAAAQM
jgi:isoquinoline 1-oxidoreductase alpha subunit